MVDLNYLSTTPIAKTVQQLNTDALLAYKAKDFDKVKDIFDQLEKIESAERKKQEDATKLQKLQEQHTNEINKQTEIYEQDKNTKLGELKGLLNDNNSVSDFFNGESSPLYLISDRLSYLERRPGAKIEKNPLNRAKEFITSFEESAISEIQRLKGHQNYNMVNKIVAKILFIVGILARDRNYTEMWQGTKKNLINAILDVFGYDFEDIKDFVIINKLNSLELVLYELNTKPYLDYEKAKWLAENVIGNKYEGLLNGLEKFDNYIHKYE